MYLYALFVPAEEHHLVDSTVIVSENNLNRVLTMLHDGEYLDRPTRQKPHQPCAHI